MATVHQTSKMQLDPEVLRGYQQRHEREHSGSRTSSIWENFLGCCECGEHNNNTMSQERYQQKLRIMMHRNHQMTSYQPRSTCRKIGLCLVGRQMRKMLVVLCLVIAMYGYVTVMNSSVMMQEIDLEGFVKVPSRDYHYVRRDGKELPLCPAYPENLQGLVYINQTKPTWEYLRDQNPDLMTGGQWAPQDCIPRHRVAIVVPYRTRETNLLLFLQHIHTFLKKQKIEYTIFVAEQAPGKTFNRGLDRNVGFVEANKLGNFDCTIFHDVDLLPIDDRNLYFCPDHPRHMCVATNYIYNYMPLYNNSYALFGGVVSFRNDQFRTVNGYSNIYFGWGAEDDDLHNRIVAKGMPPYRYPDKIGRYYGSPHNDEAVLPQFLENEQDRFKMLRISKYRIDLDGLNTMRYTVKSISKRRLFTRIYFEVEEEYVNIFKTLLYHNIDKFAFPLL